MRLFYFSCKQVKHDYSLLPAYAVSCGIWYIAGRRDKNPANKEATKPRSAINMRAWLTRAKSAGKVKNTTHRLTKKGMQPWCMAKKRPQQPWQPID